MAKTTSDAGDSMRGNAWHEITLAIVMGLATLASGWSSYQSALWDGIQTFRLTAMHDVGRDAAVQEVAMAQRRLLDTFLLELFLEARDDGNARRADFLFSRLPSELKPATRAWLETKPGDNPDAAKSPFQMAGYTPAGTTTLAELRKKEAAAYAGADEANKISDTYVRITVFLAMSMFLAGVSAVLKNAWPRRGLLAGSAVVLVFAGFLLLQMPLATE